MFTCMNDGTLYLNMIYEKPMPKVPVLDGWAAAEAGLELRSQVAVSGKKLKRQPADGKKSAEPPLAINPA